MVCSWLCGISLGCHIRILMAPHPSSAALWMGCEACSWYQEHTENPKQGLSRASTPQQLCSVSSSEKLFLLLTSTHACPNRYSTNITFSMAFVELLSWKSIHCPQSGISGFLTMTHGRKYCLSHQSTGKHTRVYICLSRCNYLISWLNNSFKTYSL